MRAREFNTKQMMEARALLGLAAVAVGAAAVAGPLLWARQTIAATFGALLAALVAALALGWAVYELPRAGLGFELTVRRRFRAVCRQKGLVIKKPGGDLLYPLLGRLSGSPASFRCRIRPLPGQSPVDYERTTEAFALAYGLTSVRFRNSGDGTLLLQAGYQRLPAHEFEAYPQMAPTAGTARERLERLHIGTAEGGRPFLLPLIDSHTLIAGITGAGKGSAIWSLLLRLLPEIESGTVVVWGIDPKFMELSLGRAFFGERYAAAPEDMVALLERAHDAMQARAAQLAGVVRRFEPSPEYPLHVVVVDELGYLASALPDRKLRERAEKALTGLLVLGRAVGFSIIGAVQDPRKSVLDFRDLFPCRVCMRISNKTMVDLVLGHGMYEAGAQADLIPADKETGAGVAFVVDEASTLPVCVRMSWVSDEAIRAAAGRLTSPVAAPRLRSVT